MDLKSPIADTLRPGETRFYNLELTAGQYARIVFRTPCHALTFALSTPGGGLLSTRRESCSGNVNISVLAMEPGAYQLEVRSIGTQTSGYEARIKEIRKALPGDSRRISAEAAAAQADQLMRAANAENIHAAIKKYEEAWQHWCAIGQESEAVDVLREAGTAYSLLGESDTALARYGRALLLSRQQKNDNEIALSLNALSHLYFSLGDNKRALNVSTQALSLAHLAANRDAEAQALADLGEVDSGVGKLQEAVDYYERALALWNESGNLAGQAQALTYLGYAYSDLSKMEQARDFYTRALALWRLVENPRGEGQTLTALGHLNSKIGEKQRALDFYQEAMRLIGPLGDRQSQAVLLNGMGYVYDQMGSKTEAIDYYRQALLLAHDKWGECLAVLAIGRDLYSLGDREHALQNLQLALTAAHSLGKTRLESHILRDLGLMFESDGTGSQALNYYYRSLALTRRADDARDSAYTYNNIGRVLEHQGNSAKAIKYYEGALALNRQSGDRFGESDTLYNIARIERNLDSLDDARAHSEQALGIVESLRANVISPELRVSYVATAHQQYELFVSILTRLHHERPNGGFAVAAFATSERGRARSLLESLNEAGADIRNGVDPTLLKREQSLEQELNAKAGRYEQLRDHSNAESLTAANEINQLRTQYNEVTAEIRERSPRYAALTQPRPLSVPEIQRQLLDDNTLLLEYMLGDERSYLWAVTRTEVSSYELAGRAEIEKAALHYYELLTAKQPRPGETFQDRQTRAQQAEGQFAGETASLSKLLLGAVANKLGARRLLIVADGALQYIPFQALTVPDGAGAQGLELRPLVQDHEIVNEPSASTLALVLNESANRKPANRSVAILADPVFELDDTRLKSTGAVSTPAVATALPNGEVGGAFRDVGVAGGRIPRLPSSRAEATAIMSMVPWHTGFQAVDFEANRATAIGADLGKYRIVHFATHALLDNERPELSGIVLSLFDKQGQRQEGFLRLRDIYNLKLPVDLVVLSACQTGLGKDVKGEGLIGLTRGFMYAGASGVVASLWKVDDDATAELMKHFYQGMFDKGLSPAAALRDAQLALRQQKRWHEPYYWAGFVIQGQYNGRASMKEFWTVQRLAALAALGACLSMAVFLVLRRRHR
jgi:CHAT domain-containing protein/Tfp pilus assembly protein PilF